MPSVGTMLVDRYVLEETISEGAMGRVYRAKDTSLGTDVAVKVILGQWLQNEEVRARFEREAMASARIHHPNVVSAIDYGTIAETGGAYLVTPLVSGENLREHLKAPLSLDEAVEITQQLCSALRAAHQSGVIHRDLKPENILLERLDESLFVRLVDFGIASEQGSSRKEEEKALTQAGVVLGTPGYMAPEQLSGEPAQTTTDVYALAVLLYEMLAGVPPFTGGLAELAAQQIHQQVDLTRLRNKAPATVRELIFRSLSPKPEERPSIDEVSEVLEHVGEASMDSERWITLWQDVRVAAKRWWKVSAGIGLVLLLTLLAVSGSGLPEELEPAADAMRNANSTNARRRAAERILAYEDQDAIPEITRVMAEFERARSCGARKKALIKLRDLPDRDEAQHIFERLDKERDGCGFLDRSDCHRCLRSELAKILED